MFRWLWPAVLAIGLGGAACAAPPPASPASTADAHLVKEASTRDSRADEAAAQNYDLERDERRGGHTLTRHVGRSDADLRRRLQQESRISAASTYTDRATAERVVARTIQRNRTRIDQWVAREGPRPNLALDYHGDADPIGRSLTRRGRQPVTCTDAVVVLRWDDRGGFYVLTSYPEASR